MIANQALALALTLAVFSASCASVPPSMDAAVKDIGALSSAEPGSFAVFGRIIARSGGESFSGSMALASDGEKYRLEALDSANRAVAAVAGDGVVMTRVDNTTGEKTTQKGNAARNIRIGSVTIPAKLLRTIVTGSPPAFVKVINVARTESGYKVTTGGPAMELFVEGGRLAGVTMAGWDNGAVSVELEPVKAAGGFRYVPGCVIKLQGGEAAIRWEKADFGKNFPAGFFTFDDVWEE